MEHDDLEDIGIVEQLELYQWALRKKRQRHIITLPEMAMLAFVDEWLAFARALLREIAA